MELPWLESGAEIKLRSGVQRRKTDKVDRANSGVCNEVMLIKQSSSLGRVATQSTIIVRKTTVCWERAKYKKHS
jgi:hypothetical protein